LAQLSDFQNPINGFTNMKRRRALFVFKKFRKFESEICGVKQLGTYQFNVIIHGEFKRPMKSWRTIS
jgi:hypothetical protein